MQVDGEEDSTITETTPITITTFTDGSASSGSPDPQPANTPTPDDRHAAPAVRSHLLDNVVWHALTGPQSAFATTDSGRARRFTADVTPMAGVDDPTDPAAWAELAALLGDEATIVAFEPGSPMPEGWESLERFTGLQLTDDEFAAESVSGSVSTPVGAETAEPFAPFPIVRLGVDDVPRILGLIDRAKPGPFLPRTIEIGAYFGIFDGEVLVAMAGERLRAPGWVEVSAVCTDADYRGRGFAARLVTAVVEHVHASGDRAFLHVVEGNPARKVYERLGFRVRNTSDVHLIRPLHAAVAGDNAGSRR